MNVLYLTMNPNRQSTTKPTEAWMRCLGKKGLQPVLVSRTLGDFDQWAIAEKIPSYQDALPIPSRCWPLPTIRSLRRLKRIVKQHGIQIIHCNEQNIYPIGSLLGRMLGIPVVVSIHFTMGRGYCEWAFSGKRCPDRIIFTSGGNMENCREGVEGIIPHERWRVLYNGLDLRDLSPSSERRSAFRRNYELNGPTVGVACALRPRKQLEHLVKSVSQCSNTSLKVVIAGAAVEGDEIYAKDLLAWAKAQLGDRLLTLGHIDDLRDFYNGIDIFINTSQEEACSLSVIESLACGCPVLGYPSKSVDDQIEPGGGEITPQDDINKLSTAIERWISDPTSLSERRDAARKHAEMKFDMHRQSEQLWREYQSLLEQH